MTINQLYLLAAVHIVGAHDKRHEGSTCLAGVLESRPSGFDFCRRNVSACPIGGPIRPQAPVCFPQDQTDSTQQVHIGQAVTHGFLGDGILLCRLSLIQT